MSKGKRDALARGRSLDAPGPFTAPSPPPTIRPAHPQSSGSHGSWIRRNVSPSSS
jgi:hypothetical protein